MYTVCAACFPLNHYISTLYCESTLRCVHVLLGLTSTEMGSEMNQRKKVEPQSRTYLLHNHHEPVVVWRCLPARMNFSGNLQTHKMNSKWTLFWTDLKCCHTSSSVRFAWSILGALCWRTALQLQLSLLQTRPYSGSFSISIFCSLLNNVVRVLQTKCPFSKLIGFRFKYNTPVSARHLGYVFPLTFSCILEEDSRPPNIKCQTNISSQ